MSVGKHMVLADYSIENAKREAQTLENAGFECSTIRCNLGSKKDILALVVYATSKGTVKHLINAAGVSPSQAPLEHILQVVLYGSSVLLEATPWGRRDATLNSISPGIIISPLANDELHGPRKEGYFNMIKGLPARRAGTPDEVGDLAVFLMSSRGRFISGADLLIDGGCTASFWYGDLQYLKATH